MNTLRSLRARMSTVVLGAMVALMVLPGMAFAQTASDDVITEVTGAFTQLRTVVLALVAGLFGLVIIGIAIRVGIKYARRGGSQA